MAMTLTEASALTQDLMLKGIIETLIKESPLMKRLPFETIEGSAYSFNREDPNNPGNVQWRTVGATWTESTAQFDSKSYHLMRLGADCDVDNFLLKTMSNINQLMAEQVAMKTKLMAHAFDSAAIYGNEDNNEPDGFHVMVADSSSFGVQIHCGTNDTGGPLTVAKLEEAIDAMKVGSPSFMLMNKAIARRFNAYLRSVASYNVERDEWGDRVSVYADIPIYTTDHIKQTEAIADGAYSAPTGGATSSVFLVYDGAGDGVVGLQNGGISYETWDRLEVKDASRTRVKWYVSLAQRSPFSVVRIDGITDAAVTA